MLCHYTWFWCCHNRLDINSNAVIYEECDLDLVKVGCALELTPISKWVFLFAFVGKGWSFYLFRRLGSMLDHCICCIYVKFILFIGLVYKIYLMNECDLSRKRTISFPCNSKFS